MNGPQISWLADGRRLHMNHGPIDLIVEAWGEAGEVRLAYEQAAARFETILGELVSELPALRGPLMTLTLPDARDNDIPPTRTPPLKDGGDSAALTPASPLRRGVRGGGKFDQVDTFTSSTARRMASAVSPFAPTFITPMAAVAGAVADEMLAAMCCGRFLQKAYVNDGGDIALHLTAGETLALGIGGTGGGGRFEVGYDMPVRGVATSGWRGRSFSLGIADAVTVLAASGAAADAAATIIANDVDLPGHPAISRTPANILQPESDLGERLVTAGVGALTENEIARALHGGLATANALVRQGLIAGVALFLAGQARMAGISGPPEYKRTKHESFAHV